VAASAGVDIPVDVWRHDTAFMGLPEGHGADLPVVIDDIQQIYLRPEGREQLLVGLEIDNVVGGSPDDPLGTLSAETEVDIITRLCERLPWMADGTMRTAHGGQDGITPDQRPIFDRVGPDGFYLDCGLSGTGFKTAPAIGQGMAEMILDGACTTVDLSPYTLERFARGEHLVGEHSYGDQWR
jgi:glycine/D-amino acid oxidase-like deaminating enzyme